MCMHLTWPSKRWNWGDYEWIYKVLDWLHELFGTLLFLYLILVISVYTLMLIFAFMQLKKDRKRDKQLEDKVNLTAVFTKPVSIIVPAYYRVFGDLYEGKTNGEA